MNLSDCATIKLLNKQSSTLSDSQPLIFSVQGLGVGWDGSVSGSS